MRLKEFVVVIGKVVGAGVGAGGKRRGGLRDPAATAVSIGAAGAVVKVGGHDGWRGCRCGSRWQFENVRLF